MIGLQIGSWGNLERGSCVVAIDHTVTLWCEIVAMSGKSRALGVAPWQGNENGTRAIQVYFERSFVSAGGADTRLYIIIIRTAASGAPAADGARTASCRGGYHFRFLAAVATSGTFFLPSAVGKKDETSRVTACDFTYRKQCHPIEPIQHTTRAIPTFNMTQNLATTDKAERRDEEEEPSINGHESGKNFWNNRKSKAPLRNAAHEHQERRTHLREAGAKSRGVHA